MDPSELRRRAGGAATTPNYPGHIRTSGKADTGQVRSISGEARPRPASPTPYGRPGPTRDGPLLNATERPGYLIRVFTYLLSVLAA